MKRLILVGVLLALLVLAGTASVALAHGGPWVEARDAAGNEIPCGKDLRGHLYFFDKNGNGEWDTGERTSCHMGVNE